MICGPGGRRSPHVFGVLPRSKHHMEKDRGKRTVAPVCCDGYRRWSALPVFTFRINVRRASTESVR
jgi:hypothetical protein